jgi:hypothetical protein
MFHAEVSSSIEPATWTTATWSGSWPPPLSTDVPAGHAMPSLSMAPGSTEALFEAIL